MTGTTHVCFKFTALKCIKWNINELSNKVSNNKTYHLQLQEELNKGWGGVEENQGPGGVLTAPTSYKRIFLIMNQTSPRNEEKRPTKIKL